MRQNDARSLGKDLTTVGAIGATPMALGLNSNVIGGLTVYMVLLIFGMMLVAGLILYASRAAKLKDWGLGLSIISGLVLFVMVIAVAIQPAAISPGEEAGQAKFEVLSVANVGGATYSQASHTFTVSATVNKTSHAITPATFYANFSVQRNDAGASTDVKTVSATMSQTSRTDPTTGLTYKCIASNSFGIPNVDWNMVIGSDSVSATDTLTAQMGLTPYQTGAFNVTVHWNGQAFTTSDVLASDVIYAATLTIGSETYTIQVVVSTVNT
jgi:hypothetical protein